MYFRVSILKLDAHPMFRYETFQEILPSQGVLMCDHSDDVLSYSGVDIHGSVPSFDTDVRKEDRISYRCDCAAGRGQTKK